NPLSGAFFGSFPTSAGHPGSDFSALLATNGLWSYPPQPWVVPQPLALRFGQRTPLGPQPAAQRLSRLFGAGPVSDRRPPALPRKARAGSLRLETHAPEAPPRLTVGPQNGKGAPDAIAAGAPRRSNARLVPSVPRPPESPACLASAS